MIFNSGYFNLYNRFFVFITIFFCSRFSSLLHPILCYSSLSSFSSLFLSLPLYLSFSFPLFLSLPPFSLTTSLFFSLIPSFSVFLHLFLPLTLSSSLYLIFVYSISVVHHRPLSCLIILSLHHSNSSHLFFSLPECKLK